jgi:coenzyme F420-reducing hydrogenase beta subunit
MNFFNSKDKTLCCGCGACFNSCPEKCIQMREDEEGFLFPVIDKLKCINCKICESICPIGDEHYKTFFNEKQDVCYAGLYNDPAIVQASSSGGAFTAIVNAFCDINYVIFGAAFKEVFNVSHTFITNKKNIEILRKSKYLQSEMNNCFIKAKEFLEEGRKILFTGTPCQIAALRSFLGKDYTNLLSIEILCHGVTSQKVFDDYIKSKEYKNKILKYSFRNKFELDKYGILIMTAKNKKRNFHSFNDNYMRGFLNVLFMRLSCAQCKFTCSTRVSDITIADFWGLKNTKLNIINGVSLLIFNTIHGKSLKKGIEQYMVLEEHKLSDVVKSNSTLIKPNDFHVKRKEFFIDMNNGMNFDDNVNEKLGKVSIQTKLKSLIPYLIKQKIKKSLKK